MRQVSQITFDLGKQLGIKQSAIENFFRLLGQEQVPDEKLAESLATIANRHKELLAQLQAFGSDDPAIATLLTQARAAIEAGEYQQAESLLARAEDESTMHLPSLSKIYTMDNRSPVVGWGAC